MSPLHEIASAVRARRDEMGLSQEKLARLSGLSRTTVNRLEQGTIEDLSVNRASRLLDVLGINLQVATGRSSVAKPASMSPLQRAAATASVSFARAVTATQLRRVLLGGPVPEDLIPHVRAFLEDAPVSLLAAVVGQLQDEDGAGLASTWRHMRELAQVMETSRDIWR